MKTQIRLSEVAGKKVVYAGIVSRSLLMVFEDAFCYVEIDMGYEGGDESLTDCETFEPLCFGSDTAIVHSGLLSPEEMATLRRESFRKDSEQREAQERHAYELLKKKYG
jgi:hypothetical protein